MNARISVRQICFIMLAYTAVSKFILYPTQLSAVSGRDLIFSALINFVLQGAIIWSVSFLCSKTDKTFFELVSDVFGKIGERIVYGLFALYFLSCALVPLLEQKVYVHAIFYDTVPSLIVFIPIFVFTLYAGAKDMQNIGRCADICLPIFLITMLLIFVMSFPEVEWSNFLPVLTKPSTVLKGGLSSAYRFSEPAFLLVFMGRFKYKKGDSAKITLSYIGGALFVIAVLAAFYGIYGDFAQSRQFAISKISLFFPAIDTLGRIDLFALYVLEIVMLFALVLNIQLAVFCIVGCTGYKNTAVISLAVNALFIVLLFLLDNSLYAVTSFWGKWMWIAALLFAYLIPLSGWLFRLKE